MDIKFFIILCIIGIITGKLLWDNAFQDPKWQVMNAVFFVSVYVLYMILRFSIPTNFFIGLAFLAFGFMIALLYSFNFPVNTQGYFFLFWFMFTLTVITIGSLIYSTYFQHNIGAVKPPKGPRGYQGEQGEDGDTLDSDLNMCLNQTTEKIEQMVRKHKKEREIPFDEKILQFNNLYIKRNLKRICSSNKYKELKAKYGNHFTPVNIVNESVDKMVKHLLKYSYGAQFLEDYFLTDYNFKTELLVNGEIESPFVYIKGLDFWMWK